MARKRNSVSFLSSVYTVLSMLLILDNNQVECEGLQIEKAVLIFPDTSQPDFLGYKDIEPLSENPNTKEILGYQPTSYDIEVFNLVNSIRKKGYTCPDGTKYEANRPKIYLTWDCRIWRSSVFHAKDMATNDYFEHNSLDGSRFFDRGNRQNVTLASENIAMGHKTPQQVVQGWLDSTTGHCNNMMSDERKTAGFAYWKNADSRSYWVQNFGWDIPELELDQSCLGKPNHPVQVSEQNNNNNSSVAPKEWEENNDSKSEPDSLNTGQITGIIIGAVALVVLLIAGVGFAWKIMPWRYKKRYSLHKNTASV